jgi:hypothetical protein
MTRIDPTAGTVAIATRRLCDVASAGVEARQPQERTR